MSHDQTRYGYHRNHQKSELPRTNGIAAINNDIIAKSHSGRPLMDGTTQYETRTALAQFGDAPPQSRPVSGIYTPPVSLRSHHRTHSDSDDVITKYPGQQMYNRTTNIIGPSASIPEHLGSGGRSSHRNKYTTEAVDGGSMSRHYDVTTDESDRKKKETPQQPKVELLTYKPTFIDDPLEPGGSRDYNERLVGETDMTLSQQETVSDIDAKIMEMMRKKKTSQGGSRTPKTNVLPTKDSMKEIMNMPPERKKKSSRTEVKRLERNSVHGVPWETGRAGLERNDDKYEKDSSQLEKKLDKKRQKVTKTESAVQLVGYRRKDNLGVTPIPEESEMPAATIPQSSSQTFSTSSKPVFVPRTGSSRFGTDDTVSVNSSFEFRTSFSPPPPPPTINYPQQEPLSPTQDLVSQMKSDADYSACGSESLSSVGGSSRHGSKDVGPSPSVFDPAEGRTVYRPNLEDTHLSDVAVFGKHFDPSQLTQDRMEANVGDLSTVGLNVPSPLKKKEGERGRKAREMQAGSGNENLAFSSVGGSKQDRKDKSSSRSKSASVSPNRRGKNENDPLSRKHDSSGSDHEKLTSWEMEVSTHASRHSSILSTPSRYKMGQFVQSFHEPVTEENNDVFTEDDITKGSMPDIYRPANTSGVSISPHRYSLRGVKEKTPDSGTSDEEKPRKKRSIGYSLGHKLSTSMKELFAKDKKSPTSRTTWHFETGMEGELYPAPSEPQLSVLTEQERKEILEETEKVPRTRSTELILSPPNKSHSSTTKSGVATTTDSGNPLAHLFVPPSSVGMATDTTQGTPKGFYEERSVDGYTERSVDHSSSKKPSNVSSDDEYETASDTEEGYVKSAVNIITATTPTESEIRKAGYFTVGDTKQESQTGKTSPQTSLTGPQTGLSTIAERLPSSDSSHHQLPSSESAPILKTLDGITDKKAEKARKKDGKTEKSLENSGSNKDGSKKEKKLFGRFSKRIVIQRRTPSPKPGSPSDSISISSEQSSGRFSPSQRPRNVSSPSSSNAGVKSQPPNVDSTRRGSKTSVGSSNSPSGSFRGSGVGRNSPFSPGGRGSPKGILRGGHDSQLSPSGGRGSPKGSFRGGSTSPLRGSLRNSPGNQITPTSGLNSARGSGFQRGINSPKPVGGLNSPQSSFQRGTGRGSPRGSTRSLQTPLEGQSSPNTKSPSPRTSMQLKVSKLSPVATRTQPSTTKVSNQDIRRQSEPVVTPLSSGNQLGLSKQTQSGRQSNVQSAAGARPKPVRQAPPPPSPGATSTNLHPLSRTISQTSTTSGDSVTSSPRQRKKGMSLTQSPLTPKRLSTVQVQEPLNDEAVAGGNDTAAKEDDIETLMSSIGEKLAALSNTPSPGASNPLDNQTEFEIPPLLVEITPTSGALFSPTGSDDKVPTYVLTPSGDLRVQEEEKEGEEVGVPSEDVKDVNVAVVTPEDSPAPVRRGLRPKTVISAFISGRGKKASMAATTKSKATGATADGGSFRKGKANSSSAVSTSEGGRKSPLVPSNKQNSASSLSSVPPPKMPAGSSTKSQQRTSIAVPGLPPRGPSLRGKKSAGLGDEGSRSQSTVTIPTIRVSEARKSMRKVSSHSAVGTSLRNSRSNSLGSQSNLVRSSIRVTGKLKKNNPISPEHRKVSTLNRPKADRPPSRGSAHSLPRNSTTVRKSVRRPVRVAPVAPNRASTHKPSTAVAPGDTQKISATNTMEMRRTSVLSKSMRKTSTIRPQGETLNRNIATRSMRMTSSRKVSTLGTMPRSSVVTKLGGSSMSTGNIQMTPARKSMRKVSSQKDVFDVFDQISADAKGKLLTSSDHRRAVRPKLRQKASSTHLRLLQDRADITSEMLSPSASDVMGGLDPNTYSTYMSKRNLAPEAVAGLAMKLDLTTVKLRKTGISDKMLSDRSADISKDLPNFAVGAEYDTKHTTMLLQIKGRRQVHTRLIEPSVSSMNSGDVYVCVSGKSIYHWVGKSANIIEKARGSDVVMRIVHKKELGCQAMAPVVIKEEVREAVTAKVDKFWSLLGGKKGIKSSESVPNDDLYEKSVNMVTTVMQLEGGEEKPHFTTIHENSNHMLKMSVLDTKKILLLDFYSEVYVWVGKMSPPKLRKKAIELAKKKFDAGCRPPVFTHQGAGGSTVIRSSGRYRAKVSSTHNPRNNTLNRSGRRVSKARKESTVSTARPSWAMFNRLNEGSEHILFREKFSDWPEQGRIIKMKGHSTAPVMPSGPVELQPADVEKMLRSIPKFEGLRLEGDNVHRGQGNYKVSRSTFACNRVHPNKCIKWVIKDNDNIVVPESDHGLFYSQEAYVIRWSYRITVVKELEGLSPGMGMFARERKVQREREEKDREVKDAQQTGEVARGNDSSDTESEEEDNRDEESRRTLESGGRDKVAYFFWQGDNATLNEKGASALLTVELDKERGPQVRVLQNKEQPAFLNLFSGGMVILNGRSETMSFQSPARPIRLFLVRGQTRSEACLVEIDPEHWPLAKFFRSRGCYVIYDNPSNKIYLWKGCKVTTTLRKVSHTAARLLKRRLKGDLVMVEEGQEPKDLCSLIGNKTSYDSLLNDTRVQDYTPRLFELSSTTGEFVASEIVYPGRDTDIEAAPFLQSDVYTAAQPAIFLLDAYRWVYVWLGWWPEERRDWSIMRETNITTGSAHARWLRDKKLALQTAQLYAKLSTESRKHKPRTYMIHAGTEPDQFIHLFPFWKPNTKVQELQCKGRKPIPQRVDVDQELLKYSRTEFTLKELQKRPLPEGVDPSRIETYISDKEFEAVLRITREQYKKFPAWKQTEIKKRHGLF